MSQTKAQLISPVGIITATGINVSGAVTASSFVGNVTGNSTGLSGTPNLNVGVTTVTGLGGVAYAGVSTTSTGKVLINREYCTAVTSVAGTVAGIAITLPSSPLPGHEVGVAVGGTFTDTVIRRNGSNIMGFAEDMTLDKPFISVQLVYTDSNVGWRFY